MMDDEQLFEIESGARAWLTVRDPVTHPIYVEPQSILDLVAEVRRLQEAVRWWQDNMPVYQ